MADTHAKHHDYHLVNPSPWPVVGGHLGASSWRSGHRLDAHAWRLAGLLGIHGPWPFAIGVRRHRIAPVRGGATSSRRPTTAITRRSCSCTSLRHDPVHRLRGDVLRRLVLGLFRCRAVPRRRARADDTRHVVGMFCAAARSYGGHWPPAATGGRAEPRHFETLRSLGPAAASTRSSC